MNVALYGAGGKKWAMTERGHADLERDDTFLRIGPSAFSWTDDALTISLREVAVPIPRKIAGTIKLFPSALQKSTFAIDSGGAHVWRPIAPVARVEVDFESPALHWRGNGYFDHNSGIAPLEDAFSHWHWSRAATNGGAAVFYDVHSRTGAALPLALQINRDGNAQPLQPPALHTLPATHWRIDRAIRAQEGSPPRVLSTLEDTPFYARSLVASNADGQAITAMHESLNLDRFNSSVVQAMLPFRMPRRARHTSD